MYCLGFNMNLPSKMIEGKACNYVTISLQLIQSHIWIENRVSFVSVGEMDLGLNWRFIWLKIWRGKIIQTHIVKEYLEKKKDQEITQLEAVSEKRKNTTSQEGGDVEGPVLKQQKLLTPSDTA